jgi:hypothetical protein
MWNSYRRAVPVAIAAVFSFAALAAAQDRPSFSPTRDVAVIYRVENGNQPTNARLAWSAKLRALRADMPTGTPASLGGAPLPPGAWVVVDLRPGRAFVDLASFARQAVELCADGDRSSLPDPCAQDRKPEGGNPGASDRTPAVS